MEFKNIESNTKDPVTRYGHTAIYADKRLYVFGGRIKQDLYFYNGDLEIYDYELNKWIGSVLYTKTIMKLRRNHIAILIGQLMLIHGGMSEDEEYLNDTFLLSFSPLKWNICAIKMPVQSLYDNDLGSQVSIVHPPTLSGHQCCLVLQSDIIKNPKFNSSDPKLLIPNLSIILKTFKLLPFSKLDLRKNISTFRKL